MEEILQSLFDHMSLFVVLVFIFLLIHFYMYQKKKKSLQQFVDKKIQTFKSIFDISEESILILSNDNTILYANKAMISLLELKKHFISSVLKIPQLKIKKEWQTLDTLLQKNSNISENMQVFPHIMLLLEDGKEEIPVNLYVSHTYVDPDSKIPCTIITINDLRKKKEMELLGTRHKLTKLPNQTKALSDLNALYAKLHLTEQTIALAILNIDNFSTLRSIVGYEQSNIILIKLAKYLDKLAKELSFSVYHTAHNNFLLIIPKIDSSRNVISIVDKIQNELSLFTRWKIVNCT